MKKKLLTNLTAKRLREVLDYDQKTGVFRWRISPTTNIAAGSIAGSLDVGGYWIICVNYQNYRAHRLAWLYVHGRWPKGEMDHRDLVRHHNWIANLREASQTQNNANRRSYRNNQSGLKGAHPQNGRWRADIRFNGKGFYLGMFDTPEEAHAAYVAKASELFGSFANDGR